MASPSDNLISSTPLQRLSFGWVEVDNKGGYWSALSSLINLHECQREQSYKLESTSQRQKVRLSVPYSSNRRTKTIIIAAAAPQLRSVALLDFTYPKSGITGRAFHLLHLADPTSPSAVTTLYSALPWSDWEHPKNDLCTRISKYRLPKSSTDFPLGWMKFCAIHNSTMNSFSNSHPSGIMEQYAKHGLRCDGNCW
ncbi:hypothetical protein MUK42_10882 [Musa troglodytarum]|uniref:Uncharacterized protein n=1 Tax=Musa troglodytarum TaxID=320322 RepID=A0A9E7JY69_9LILI|nr:hypothetical protein MUK42_10882 [Musa troglodytarum]